MSLLQERFTLTKAQKQAERLTTITMINTPNTPFIAPDWQSILAFNHLDTFHALWQTAIDLVDNPNQQGKGCSVVGTKLLQLPNGNQQLVYIKKQQHYMVRRWWNGWWRKLFACEAEFYACNSYHAVNIATLTPIYFEKSMEQGDSCAILITLALDNYTDINTWRDTTKPSIKKRYFIIRQVAQLIKNLHDKGWMHYSLYPKHIFIRENEVCLIDLEKTRRFLWRWQAIKRDLSTLYRRAIDWSNKDAWCFLLAYCGGDKRTARGLWNKLVTINPLSPCERGKCKQSLRG